MKRFQNIVYVSHGVNETFNGLIQAISLAQKNNASLSILIVYPELPKTHEPYRGIYEKALAEGVQQQLQKCVSTLGIKDFRIAEEHIISGKALATLIVRFVLRNSCDLLVKEAEAREKNSGLRAIDMELLRLCPCPVWLGRPLVNRRDALRVGVAIDPDTNSSEERDLAIDLLRLAGNLSDAYNSQLSLVSCWEYEFEEFLRRNVWFDMPEDDVIKVVQRSQFHQQQEIERLTIEAGLQGRFVPYLVRGLPDDMIPKLVQQNRIDLLVMGTLARSGIPGFVIGNTAENIVQNLSCALLAVKPASFISPVNIYG